MLATQGQSSNPADQAMVDIPDDSSDAVPAVSSVAPEDQSVEFLTGPTYSLIG